MNEEFFKDRAKTVRDIADKADPFIKKRLLALAARYEAKPRPPSPVPPVSIQQKSHNEDGGNPH